jgi:hypothetical protein
MSDELPGPHHCIGTARAVTELVFRGLRAECAASGGTMSLVEIENFYSRIIDSFSSGFDLFELRHSRCMDASLSRAAMPFARSKILATLLRACGEKSADAAFSVQIGRLGVEWIDQLFGALAHYVRRHVAFDFEARLITAYVDTATMNKAMPLTIDELLRQTAVQNILLDCVTEAFDRHDAPELVTRAVCDSINEFMTEQRGIEGPHVCKVTESESSRFLTLLPRQLRATINVMTSVESATAPSISAA